MSSLTYTQRRYFDERLYFLYVSLYRTKDFTQWISTPEDEREDIFWAEIPSLVEKFANNLEARKYNPFAIGSTDRINQDIDTWQPIYDDVMPTYCSGFKSYFGYILMTGRPLSILSKLDRRFPKPDEVDCYYLNEVFEEISIDLQNGFGYDPGQRNGLDKYLPPEPALAVNLGTAKRWLTRATAKAALLPPIVYKSLSDVFLRSLGNSKENHIMRNPSTILGRSELAEAEYLNIKSRFSTRDFIKWKVPTRNPDGTNGTRPYEELIPPYCRRYATALGYIFSCINTDEVPLILDKHFTKPDKLDLDYLDDVLTKIGDVIDANYSFSSSSGDGIDYYNGFGNEHQMMEAAEGGVDTSNKGEWRVKLNIERTRKWMTRARENLLTIPPQTEAGKSTDNSAATEIEQPNLEPPVVLPTLSWNGSTSDLAETLYRLARAGLIDLAAHCPPKGNRLALCRHLCQLFQVPVTARTGVVKNLNAYLAKFTAEQLAPGPFNAEVLSKAIGRKPNSRGTQHLDIMLDGLTPTDEAEPELG